MKTDSINSSSKLNLPIENDRDPSPPQSPRLPHEKDSMSSGGPKNEGSALWFPFSLIARVFSSIRNLFFGTNKSEKSKEPSNAGEIAVLNARIEGLNQRIERLDNQNKELTDDNAKLNTEIGTLNTRIRELDKQNKELEDVKTTLEQQVENKKERLLFLAELLAKGMPATKNVIEKFKERYPLIDVPNAHQAESSSSSAVTLPPESVSENLGGSDDDFFKVPDGASNANADIEDEVEESDGQNEPKIQVVEENLASTSSASQAKENSNSDASQIGDA